MTTPSAALRPALAGVVLGLACLAAHLTVLALPLLVGAAGLAGRTGLVRGRVVLALATVLLVGVGWSAVPAAAVSSGPLLRLGLLLAGLVVPWSLGRYAADRAVQRERDRRLAEASREVEAARLDQARALERQRIAGELHDSLGHQVALVAMRCSALEVGVAAGTGSPPGLREELAALRATAAGVAERLHDVVTLLADQRDPSAVDDVGAIVAGARDAGLEVTGGATEADLADLDEEVARTVRRVVGEGLTNAVKHAPGSPVAVDVDRHDGRVVVTVADEGPTGDPPPPAPGGLGLAALTERVASVGGRLERRPGPTGSTLRADLPPTVRRPAPRPSVGTTDRPAPPVDGARRWTGRRVALVAGAVVAGTLLAVAGGFVVVTVLSVLPDDRAALLEPGRSRASAEEVLPPVEMAEPPRDRAGCAYYEAAVSFFERVDVHEVCFDDDRVTSVTTIRPTSR